MAGEPVDTTAPPESAGEPLYWDGGVGLSSAESRRMSVSIGSLVATLPEGLADLSGPLGERVRRELPNTNLARRINME